MRLIANTPPRKIAPKSETKRAVDLMELPGLTKTQIAARLSANVKAGKVAEMTFRDAGITQA